MIDRADLPKLLEHWRTMPPHSDQVAAADIIDELQLEIRKLENQRADFRRQLAAERQGRMAAERVVDEVRARNRELEGGADSHTTNKEGR